MGGRVWTQAEDEQIRAAMGQFGALAAVGRRIGRSPGAVRVRAHVLRQADPGIEHEAAGIEHGPEHVRAAYPEHTPAGPILPYRPRPPGVSAAEFERRVNEQVEKLRAQHLQGRTPPP